MTEPRRKLSIAVPELPWEKRQKDPDLSTWEEARQAAMKKAASSTRVEAEWPKGKTFTEAEQRREVKTRWAGTD